MGVEAAPRREHHMKKLFASLAMTLLLASLVAPLLVTSAVANAPIDRVAIITPASRTNQAWDQQGVDNLTSVGVTLGIKVEVAENAGYEDITPILQDLTDDGSQLIFCHASGYQTVCPEYADTSGVPVVVIENPGAIRADSDDNEVARPRATGRA